jgi:predicted nucleotidyltransferase
MIEGVVHATDSLPAQWEAVPFAHTLCRHLPELRTAYSVDSLALFGSYVRNEQRPDSDLDVLVTFDPTPTLFEFVRLQDHLSSLLGVPVDLVMRTALRRRIGRNILREAVPV